MKSFIVALMVLLMVVVTSSMTYAQSADGGAGEIGEGTIMIITEDMIVVDDLSMKFPTDISPVAENGQTLSRSSLQVGDKVLYRTDEKHVIVSIAKFDNP